MGGGPVLWLEMEEEDEEDDDEEEEEEEDEDRDRDWSLGSPLKAASPEENKNRRETVIMLNLYSTLSDMTDQKNSTFKVTEKKTHKFKV